MDVPDVIVSTFGAHPRRVEVVVKVAEGMTFSGWEDIPEGEDVDKATLALAARVVAKAQDGIL